jgi:hypothetical protein
MLYPLSYEGGPADRSRLAGEPGRRGRPWLPYSVTSRTGPAGRVRSSCSRLAVIRRRDSPSA